MPTTVLVMVTAIIMAGRLAMLLVRGAGMDDSLLMRRCEQKKLFKRNEVRTYEWTPVAVADIPEGAAAEIRCLYCHGRVRIHRQQVEHGPADHVEHRVKRDSEGCKGGHYFLGVERMPDSPVE